MPVSIVSWFLGHSAVTRIAGQRSSLPCVQWALFSMWLLKDSFAVAAIWWTVKQDKNIFTFSAYFICSVRSALDFFVTNIPVFFLLSALLSSQILTCELTHIYFIFSKIKIHTVHQIVIIGKVSFNFVLCHPWIGPKEYSHLLPGTPRDDSKLYMWTLLAYKMPDLLLEIIFEFFLLWKCFLNPLAFELMDLGKRLLCPMWVGLSQSTESLTRIKNMEQVEFFSLSNCLNCNRNPPSLL